MANSYKDWEAFPLADSPSDMTVGSLGTGPIPGAGQTVSLGKMPEFDYSSRPVDLVAYRSRFQDEMNNNSDLQRKLMASVQAEVGGQGEQSKLAYLETVFNRATARGLPLDEVISDPHYYPKTTTSKLGAVIPEADQNVLKPLIDRALQGSNISNYATGNESGKVHSGGAPVTFDPGRGERFVIENPDAKWSGAIARLGATPAPTPMRPASDQQIWDDALRTAMRTVRPASPLRNLSVIEPQV